MVEMDVRSPRAAVEDVIEELIANNEAAFALPVVDQQAALRGHAGVPAFGWLREPLDDGKSPKWATFAARTMPWLVALSVVIAAGSAYLSGKPWMVFFEDDFYYYLKIAQNIVHGSGSTFNGVVPTNGYHPLWLLVMTGVSLFATRGPAIFGAVACIALLSTLATFFLARRLLRQMHLNRLLENALAAYIGIYGLHLFYTGMEVILAIPLMFLFLVVAGDPKYRAGGFVGYTGLGLITCAMVLSRLDLILLVALVGLFSLINGEVRQSLTAPRVAGLLLGMSPLALYFVMNHLLFDTWFPVSGMAKQLKFTHGPSLKPWLAFYGRNVNHWLNLSVVHVGLFCLPLVWKRLGAIQRVLFPAILLFPFFYLAVLCCVSDWQIWLWYLYPLRAALCVSFIVLSLLPRVRTAFQTKAFALAVSLVIVGQVSLARWWTDVQPAIYDAAIDIQNFAKTHPGVYAMGDRSGMVGYLLPYPVIQTEGLVMDRPFLERIRRQESLIPALKAYHVRYYVGTSWVPYTGCFHAVEPFQAGKTSAHMVGDFCQPAIAQSQHEFFRTRIFDLGQ